MTDSAASFTADALIGRIIYNTTDGSKGTITDNTDTTVTVAALTGGTDNDWDTSDAYAIGDQILLRYRKFLPEMDDATDTSALPEIWDRAIILIASYFGFDELGEVERASHYRSIATAFIRNQDHRLVENLQDRDEPIAPIGGEIVLR
jgi:hypothetical protein